MHSNILAQVFLITASLFLSALPVFSQQENGSENYGSPRTVLNFHEKPLPGPPPAPKAGVLTAAEWSDLENREFWQQLLDNDFAAFAEKWGILQLAGSGVDETASLPDCPQGNGLDLLFAIDATGSMADELAYLQAELADVIRRVHRVQPGLQTRSAVVFFRDKEESYLTKSTPFSPDNEKTIDFLRQQRAGGGGQTPEAVEAALEEALRLGWSEHARTRLLFLITDATPDPEPEVRQKLQSAIRSAAVKDIRIIPVAASETTKEGEFVLRAIALATRSPYVFLSDDSGVGDIHEEPSIGGIAYVQPFNDLLVRLIVGYTASMPCPQGDAARLPSGSASELLAVRCFPNPTSGIVHIHTADKAEMLTVYNAQGQTVLRQNPWPAGAYSLDLTDRPPGVYLLEFRKNDKVKTVRVVVE